MSDDPAVQAAMVAVGEVSSMSPEFRIRVVRAAVEAARPIIRAEYEAQIGGERLVHRLKEIRLREEVGLRPRWEDDPIVIANGWIEGRCAGCGDPLPRAAVRTEPEQ